jgi:alkylation response protein AidB-like acyl-CoA dehydrogenase
VSDQIESIDDFRSRARAWAVEHLPEEGDETLTDKELQALIFDAGFAGIAMPKEYGGCGLTFEHQKAFFDDACAGRRVPVAYMVSIGMLGPTLNDHGSDLLKARHLPRILRGDEEWIQLLSEPSGGSDMAGAITRLTRDGDSYVLNGAKMWSTGAAQADWGMCLARTDWDAPKHRGLSMIAVPLKGTPGVVIEPIRQVTGAEAHFCQEFFDDVVLPAEWLIGEQNSGWAVAQTLLHWERLATAGAGHGYGLTPRSGHGEGLDAIPTREVVDAVRRRARGGADAVAGLRQLVAESHIERTVARYANDRVMTGMRTGHFKGQWGSLLKLHLGADSPRQAKIALAAYGADGVIWDGDEPITGSAGENWLGSRGIAIAGGSNEMQRNIVSERLMGLPREPSFDRDIPFNEVLRNRSKFTS